MTRGRFGGLVVAAALVGSTTGVFAKLCMNCLVETRAGGDTTLDNATSQAFALPAPNLSAAQLDKHRRGDRAFDHQFVSAGNAVRPGLGPVFNADSCASCHTGNGRGRLLDTSGRLTEQFFLRLSAGHRRDTGAPVPVPGYGVQLQRDALFGVPPEGDVRVRYSPVTGHYADGTSYTLQRPHYSVEFGQREPPDDLVYSPRLAPSINGVGLLEAIPAARLRALADPGDTDGDGVSGKLQEVVNEETGAHEIGRFGWKAITPSVRQQTADAYQQDMGATNPARLTESSVKQPQDDQRSDDPEVDERTLDATAFYVATLGVPAARDTDDPDVARGGRLFNTPTAAGGAGCAACHTPTQRTASAGRIASLLSERFPDASANPLADQTFHPYTDLLLHDMGEGLADGRGVYRASGREWRTPPLWGIGLTGVVNGHPRYLHDGRARSLAEAVLWHGGEAKAAREAFRNMVDTDRTALIVFLKSL